MSFWQVLKLSAKLSRWFVVKLFYFYCLGDRTLWKRTLGPFSYLWATDSRRCPTKMSAAPCAEGLGDRPARVCV